MDVTTDFKWPWLMLVLALVVIGLLVWWARAKTRRTPAGAAYVAHAARLRSLPRFQSLVRRQVILASAASLAALIACSGAIVLAGRVQDRQVMNQEDATRDIMLCLDSSGSMAEVDAQVLREFQKIVAGLQGERIGLTIFSGVAISVFPLTDDYEFVQQQLSEAETAFGSASVYSDEYASFTAGTVVDWEIQSQMGDGLASCVQRFDRRDEERSRAIVLASDNEPIGQGIFTLDEAADLAADRDVVVHGIAAPATASRPSASATFEAITKKTKCSFDVLGDDGSAETVVEAIADLEAKPIPRPPLVQVLDRPRAGTIVAGIGLLGLLVIWVADAAEALGQRRRP